MSYIISKQLKQ